MNTAEAQRHAENCGFCKEFGTRWCQGYHDIEQGRVHLEPCLCGDFKGHADNGDLCSNCGGLGVDPETFPGYVDLPHEEAACLRALARDRQANTEQSRAEVRALLPELFA